MERDGPAARTATLGGAAQPGCCATRPSGRSSTACLRRLGPAPMARDSAALYLDAERGFERVVADRPRAFRCRLALRRAAEATWRTPASPAAWRSCWAPPRSRPSGADEAPFRLAGRARRPREHVCKRQLKHQRFQVNYRVVELEALYEVGLAVAATLDLDRLSEEILLRAVSLLDARRGALYLLAGEALPAGAHIGGDAAAAREADSRLAALLAGENPGPVDLLPGARYILSASRSPSTTSPRGLLVVADKESRRGRRAVRRRRPAHAGAVRQPGRDRARERAAPPAGAGEGAARARDARSRPRSSADPAQGRSGDARLPDRRLESAGATGGRRLLRFPRNSPSGRLGARGRRRLGQGHPGGAAGVDPPLGAARCCSTARGRTRRSSSKLNRHILESSDAEQVHHPAAGRARAAERQAASTSTPGTIPASCCTPTTPWRRSSRVDCRSACSPTRPIAKAVSRSRPGDLLCLYSDGITEQSAASDEEFGVDRLWEVLRSHRAQPLGEIVQAIDAAVIGYAAGSPQGDDQTIVLMRREA